MTMTMRTMTARIMIMAVRIIRMMTMRWMIEIIMRTGTIFPMKAIATIRMFFYYWSFIASIMASLDMFPFLGVQV